MDRVTKEEEKFNRFVLEHSSFVLKYLRNRMSQNSVVAAEDILNDVMKIAWKRLDSIPEAAERPWLVAVARNRVLNERAKRSRRNRINQLIPRRGASPSAEELSIADSTLRTALLALRESDRETILLVYWEGLKPEELALALGTSSRTAAVRLSRAKQSLMKLLEESQGDDR